MIIPVDRLLAESNLDREQASRIDRFIEMMLETNAHTNLTRITDPELILTDHILDSLSVLDVVRMNEGSALCDVGCGAGFPGMILKIARPDLDVTLMDSTGKKLSFIDSVIDDLGLENVRTLRARAEEAGRTKLRESFDFVTARAVADMKVLAELCLPLVKVGGSFVAMKSAAAEEEIAKAKPMIGTLGGRVAHTEAAGKGLVVRVAKEKLTPRHFPREYKDIVK
ncbi:MAG: 16S rRNA (guanine(527)-N(7))-methyltransferase RsmG [Abditibacteriota bacterium]|nr:16S rRNA (guanine(527)-N(7))-methyltransferase RsmG [Abditibacteriota bacterium]